MKGSVSLLILLVLFPILVASCGSGLPRDGKRYLEEAYDWRTNRVLVEIISATPNDPIFEGDEEWCVWVEVRNPVTDETFPEGLYMIRVKDEWDAAWPSGLLFNHQKQQWFENLGCPGIDE